MNSTGSLQKMRCLFAFYLTVLIGWAASAEGLEISWTNNLLTLSDPRLPDGKLEVWYLEAFCRRGAWGRDWRETVLPHRTTLIQADSQRRHLKFFTAVDPNVEVMHEINASKDELNLDFKLTNKGNQPVDLQWFEPACIRVAAFTGCEQNNYIARSFIFTRSGLTTLDQLRRTTNALYLGGQVYLPAYVAPEDANPRPICSDQPVNGIIGCFSRDDRWLLATASDRTHELFEGVYVCLHSDPRIEGLAPGASKRVRSKIYLLPNKPKALLRRYQKDFPEWRKSW
jgi:hypothetical protein